MYTGKEKIEKKSQARFTEKSMPCFGLNKPIAPQQPSNSYICDITTTIYLFDTVKYHDILLTESNRRQNFQNIAEICKWERMNDNNVSKHWRLSQKDLAEFVWEQSKMVKYSKIIVDFQDDNKDDLPNMMPSLERYHLPSSGYCIIEDYLSSKERT